MEIPNDYKKNIYLLVLIFGVIISAYFVMKFLTELKSYTLMNGDQFNTISLTGHGEVQAVPDIANISFSINREAKTVKEAQTLVAEVEKKALDFLKENKVAEKDIKTSNASFYPKYEYRYQTCNQYGCPGNKSIIVGYTSTETISVKIRNTDDVGKIAEGLGALEVSEFNGPNFSIDDEEALKVEARKEAIIEAQEKAKTLAKDLGVRLGKIVSFSEGNDYPGPMYDYADGAKLLSSSVAREESAQLPKGENTISSDVTIIYQIR